MKALAQFFLLKFVGAKISGAFCFLVLSVYLFNFPTYFFVDTG